MKTIKKVGNTSHEICLYTCKCGAYDHQLILSYWHDIPAECFLSWIVSDGGLWQRIKAALGFIFKGEKLYITEVGLDIDDLREIVNGINKYLRLDKD